MKLNTETKQDFKRSLIGILIGLGAFVLYMITEGLYIFPAKSKLQLDREFFIFVASLVVLLIIYGIYFWQLSKYNSWGFDNDWLKINKSDWKKWLITLGAFALMFIIQLLGTLISGTSSNQSTVLEVAKYVNLPLFKAFLVLIAPLFEEAIFRGLFFNALFTKKTKLDGYLGIIVNGALFALMHGLPTSGFYLIYWALGSVLAANYLITKDLRCNIMLHIINNALIML